MNDNPILSPKELRKILTKLMNPIRRMLRNLIRKQNKTLPILKPALQNTIISLAFNHILNANQPLALQLNQPKPQKLLLNHPNRMIEYLVLDINND